tara:strand:+ start:404 stop:637 length:234 start_codon:yes stop_codon:yes gene_type:complete
MIKNLIANIKTTFFGGMLLSFVGVHTLEDVMLLSIGRFLPVPTVLMYIIGLMTSWIVMAFLVKKFGGVHKHNVSNRL